MKMLVSLVMLSVAVPAFAKDWSVAYGPDGNRLIVLCKTALQVHDAARGETHANGTTLQDAYDEGYCEGLVAGIASSLISNEADLLTPHPPVDQLIRVVQKYMEDHPEELSKPAVLLIRVSLIKAFPKKP